MLQRGLLNTPYLMVVSSPAENVPSSMKGQKSSSDPKADSKLKRRKEKLKVLTAYFCLNHFQGFFPQSWGHVYLKIGFDGCSSIRMMRERLKEICLQPGCTAIETTYLVSSFDPKAIEKGVFAVFALPWLDISQSASSNQRLVQKRNLDAEMTYIC